jgi:hypothetical protein
MTAPTLVVSNPPHGEVDLEAAANLLELDVYTTRQKSVFGAPEIMDASGPEQASEFATALRSTGFKVEVLPGAVLAEVPWPDPVSTLTLDLTSLQMTGRSEGIRIPFDAEVVGVYCRPPAEGSLSTTVDVHRAIESEHGPTIAEAIHRRSILDLYTRHEGALRRATVVPDLLKLDADRIVRDIGRRLTSFRLDVRLVGVRPRAPFAVGGATAGGPERRRYSFGTLMLYEALASIAPELRAVPQYELGSRLAYALSPLGALARPG